MATNKLTLIIIMNMKKELFIKAELNRDTLLYNVTTGLDDLYPNASVVIKNCINSRERSYHNITNQRTEITNAIDDGLRKLHRIGIFQQSEICYGDNCITLLNGGLSI